MIADLFSFAAGHPAIAFATVSGVAFTGVGAAIRAYGRRHERQTQVRGADVVERANTLA